MMINKYFYHILGGTLKKITINYQFISIRLEVNIDTPLTL